MAKFKKGDRVRVIQDKQERYHVPYGAVGIVQEIDDAPFVQFGDSGRWAINEDNLELVADKETTEALLQLASDIAQIIEKSKLNSWDDSVEISESMDLPVDKFEFRYTDEYGRDVSHKFTQSEGDYWIEDVVAEFANFLFGVGYAREDVYKYIREDRL